MTYKSRYTGEAIIPKSNSRREKVLEAMGGVTEHLATGESVDFLENSVSEKKEAR